jgi:hypothetical protein
MRVDANLDIAAMSDLLQRAEEAAETTSALLTRNRRGLLVKTKAGRVVTEQMAKELAEDDVA